MFERLNILLLLLVVASSIGVVASQHKSRNLFTELERSQEHMRNLDVEWGQLQLEQSTWAAHARVEKIARDRLNMRLPVEGKVIAIGDRR